MSANDQGKIATSANDDGWRTVGKNGSGDRNRNNRNNRNNRDTRGNGRRSGSRGTGRQNGRHNKDKPDTKFLIKTIVQGCLSGFVTTHDHLPTLAELLSMISSIFEDMQTPNRRVTSTEYKYRQSLKLADHIGMIKATMINTIYPELLHFVVDHPELETDDFIKGYIDDLAPLIHEVDEFGGKSANGYQPLNQLFWSKRLREEIKAGLAFPDPRADRYVEVWISIIKATDKMDVGTGALNKNSEDRLLSYLQGVTNGRSIFHKDVVGALAADLDTETLVRKVINKISPKMPDTIRVKLHYLVIIALDSLVRGMLINVLGSYVFAKKRGVHDRVTSFIGMALDFLKVKEGQFSDKSDALCIWLKDNYVYNDQVKEDFLRSMVDQAVLLLSEKEKREQNLFTSQWAWDTIGGLLGEISVILDDPQIFKEFFKSQLHAVEPGSDGENQILTLVAHLILRLKQSTDRSSAAKRIASLSRFLPMEVCYDLSRMDFGSRTRMLIEDQISEFLAHPLAARNQIKMLKLSELGGVLHAGTMAEYIEVCEAEEAADAGTDVSGVDQDGDDIMAKARVGAAVDCDFARTSSLGLSTEVKKMPATEFPVFMGWRLLCIALARGVGKWSKVADADDWTMYQMLGNIAYYVGSELHPADEMAETRDKQITALATVLKAHIELPTIQTALTSFNADLAILSAETRDYLWDNRRGKQNFADFCRAFDVETCFA